MFCYSQSRNKEHIVIFYINIYLYLTSWLLDYLAFYVRGITLLTSAMVYHKVKLRNRSNFWRE